MFALFTLLASSAILASAAPAPIRLGIDDVVLYGNGRYSVIKRDLLQELDELRRNGTVPPMPDFLNTTLFHGPNPAPASPPSSAPAPSNSTATPRSLRKRASTTFIVPNEPTRFLGWDVVMSSIVKGPSSVSVTAGYSIANSISVGSSATFTLIKDFLEASVKIDASKTWTSSQLQTFQSTVPEGKYGAYVSNAWTNRHSGNVFEGTIGSEGSLTYYQADMFDEKKFGDMTWVDGVISLCLGDTFPMKRCLGDGQL